MAKVIAFFGGDSQTGTTSVAASVCEALSQKGFKVLFILASCEGADEQFPSKQADLGTLLRISRVIREDIESCTVKGKSFDFIPGPSDLLKKQFFEPALISRIAALCGGSYDFIICDAGRDVTLPLPVSCLAAADRRFYVLTGNAKCVSRFSETLSVLRGLRLDETRDMLILNKALAAPSLYTLGDLAKTFGMKGLSLVRFENPELYEFNRAPVFGRDAGFTRGIGFIADEIAAESGKAK